MECSKCLYQGDSIEFCAQPEIYCRAVVEQLQTELAEAKERIELAVDYLPECPDKAKGFLVNPKRGKNDG
ncbi:hypothetical protein LCGC14_0376200 [marine sediment metagenome]|uniref:Uncharacterized protein n=1 Tax=marine sediment metagenome TaxID=412755 RepID=A0A0F9TLY2_9ZZZZ